MRRIQAAGSIQNRYIALFGYYRYGNFGDDLMAVIFGRELQAREIPFRIYGLPPQRLAEFQFRGAESIDDLLTNAAAVVYGGGGAFLEGFNNHFERELQQLCDSCSEKNIPIFLFSVGSQGQGYHKLSKPRRALLDSASYVTFRNKLGDAPLFQHIEHKKGAIYEDIVWRTANYFTSKRNRHGGGLRIGIDYSLQQGLRRETFSALRNRFVLFLIRAMCKLSGKSCRFVFTMMGQGSNRTKDISYEESMDGFLSAIRGLDLVITHRLHLGMVAMTYDIPVIQLFPRPKAAILFRHLGIEHLEFSSLRSLSGLLLWLARDKSAILSLKPSKEIRELAHIVEDSRRHLDALIQCLGQVQWEGPIAPILKGCSDGDKSQAKGSGKMRAPRAAKPAR